MRPMTYRTLRHVAFASACVALNVGLGKASNLVGLPFTADTVGTCLAALLLPWPLVVVVGVASSVIASAVIHPAFIYYAGTQVAIALTAVLFVRVGAFKRLWTAALAGLAIGVVSAVVSSPVTAVVFGGVAVPSITALNAVMLAAGKSLWTAVITGALVVESIDKAIAGVLVWLTIKRLPRRMLLVDHSPPQGGSPQSSQSHGSLSS